MHNTNRAHHLIQGDVSSEVNKIRYTEHVGCLPDRLLVSALEVDSGSAHREGELGVICVAMTLRIFRASALGS